MRVKATKRQRTALREYARWMANELELRDWTINLVYEPAADDDAMAQVTCTYGRKFVTIKLAADFFQFSLEKQRQAIVHELLHCHTSGIEWQYNNLGGHIAPDVFSVCWGGIRDQVEFATDAMADALAKHLPLPNYAKEAS